MDNGGARTARCAVLVLVLQEAWSAANEPILRELGYGVDQVQQLKRSGILRASDPTEES
jgi:hypothetical protein